MILVSNLAKGLIVVALSVIVVSCSFSVALVSVPLILLYLISLFMLIFLGNMKRWARRGSFSYKEGVLLSGDILKDSANLYVPCRLPLYNPIRNFMFSCDSSAFLQDSSVFLGGSSGYRNEGSTESTQISDNSSQTTQKDSYNTESDIANLMAESVNWGAEAVFSHPCIDTEMKTFGEDCEDDEDFHLDMLFNSNSTSRKPNTDGEYDFITEMDASSDAFNNSKFEEAGRNNEFSAESSNSVNDSSLNQIVNDISTESSITGNSTNTEPCIVIGETNPFAKRQINGSRHPTLLRSKTERPSNWHSLTSHQLPCVIHPLSPESKYFCTKQTKSEGGVEDDTKLAKGFQATKQSDKEVSKSEKLEKQYENYGKSKPDTVHFMKTVESFSRPIESEISSYTHTQVSSEPRLPHPIWDEDAVKGVKVTHFQPKNVSDFLAFVSVKILRALFDLFSGYSIGYIDERGWINRIVFLETIAGVPGMVGAMIRHLNSLRRMEKDYGWIHVLLEEAENERMHLMTAILLKKPSKLFRFGIITTQAFFLTIFSISYFLFPQFSHRVVGYFEEEAVRTYTKLIYEIDENHLPLFTNQPAPPVAIEYWKLSHDAKLRDVFLAIRADESHHREVNHSFASISQKDKSPF